MTRTAVKKSTSTAKKRTTKKATVHSPKEENFRYCTLLFCRGIVFGNHNKKRCEPDRNIHLHMVISGNVKKIMAFIESKGEFTAQDINIKLYKKNLDKNEKGSLYRLLQAMIREGYCKAIGKSKDGIKLFKWDESFVPRAKKPTKEEADSYNPDKVKRTPLNKRVSSPKRRVAKKVDPMVEIRKTLKWFIEQNHGHYGHQEWLQLLSEDAIKNSNLQDAEIGMMLEEEKARFNS